MKLKLTNLLSVLLAAMLQFMPLLRSALPTLQSLTSPTGSLILRWVAGGVAFFGYHSISSASGIAISPPTATIGQFYSGTISYSGSHAGSVNAMSITNSCLGSYSVFPGLTVSYTGGYTASISGTPTGTIGTVPFTVKVWEGSGCTGSAGVTDTRTTSLIIQNSGGSAAAPSITVAPQNIVAQVGSTVVLSGGATGNPAPAYYWKQGITAIAGATNNTLTITNIQLTNAGLYTMTASNSQGTANSACYLSVALTAGSNILAYLYTNYAAAGVSVTMNSSITNVPSATNTYDWTYGGTDTGVTTPSLTLPASAVIPFNSGIYTIYFTSKVGSTTIVNQGYDSYWTFGYVPAITNQPANVNVASGSNATFSVTIKGTSPTLLWYQNATNLVAVQNYSNLNTNSSNTNLVASLTISNATVANAGTYSVVETNFWGSTVSSNATLSISSSLSVTAPTGQTNYAGKNVSLAVTATGSAPIGYQWQQGGVNLSNGGNISGVTTNVLSIAPAATNNSGNYQVVVTNSSGSVTSSIAAVSIVPVPKFALAVSNHVSLSAPGAVVGSNYVVEYSTNLTSGAGWVPLTTNAVPSGGVINFTDTNAITGQRFYRLQFP